MCILYTIDRPWEYIMYIYIYGYGSDYCKHILLYIYIHTYIIVNKCKYTYYQTTAHQTIHTMT